MNESSSFTVKASDGNEIFMDRWESPEPPKSDSPRRVLFVLHGYGEHSGRYKHVPKYLSKQFDRFYAMDIRGHGRSGGLRGHSPSFDILISDMKIAIAEMMKREPGSRFFFLAHSFGGLIALKYLLTEKKVPFEFAAISAPLLEVAMPVPKALIAVAGFLNKTLSKIQLGNEINPMHLSHDPVSTENFLRDRLVHHKITPRMYFSMLEGMQWVKGQSGPLACPTLFMVAGDDQVVSTPAVLAFYKNLKYRDKELKQYPGMYHEIMNEVERGKVFDDIQEWTEKRAAAGAA